MAIAALVAGSSGASAEPKEPVARLYQVDPSTIARDQCAPRSDESKTNKQINDRATRHKGLPYQQDYPECETPQK
jgi:hypothetical protein